MTQSNIIRKVLVAMLLSIAVSAGSTLAQGQAKKDAAPLSAQQLEAIWTELILNDDEGAGKAFEKMRLMIRAPQMVVPFIKDRVKPAPVADAKRLEQLIADLDSDNFQAREQASKSLATIGVLAVPAMEMKIRANPSLEVRQRLETLIQKIDDRPLPAEDLRSVRAIMVLEAIATPEALTVLANLAKGGAGAITTEQARQALARLVRRSAGK